MARRQTLSVRLKLTLSYAAVFTVANAALLILLYMNLIWPIVETEAPPGEEAKLVPATLLDLAYHVWYVTPGLLIGLLGLFVFGMIGAWFLAGRMLRPIKAITQAARKTLEGSFSHRVNLPGPNDEFRQVADAFDRMLAYVERSVGEHQRFAANASHELRTPLTISRSLIEVGLTDPHTDTQALLAELDTANTRAIELTEALLLLSRIDAGQFQFELVNLALITDKVTETNTKLADQFGVSIDIDTESRQVSGSAILLEQLVGNLVRNAIVHNVSVDGRVWVSVGGDPELPRITIENTGPDLTAQEVIELTAPFRRGAGRTRTTAAQHVGAGLGLALVASITNAHGANLDIRPRPTGGLTVAVTFTDAGRVAAP